MARRLLVPVMAGGTVAAGALAVVAVPAQAVPGNVGYACAYHSNVSLFGGPYGTQGCSPQTSSWASANSLAPSATLPADGTLTSAFDGDGAMATYGPAHVVSSPYEVNDRDENTGPLRASTGGTRRVTSKAKAVAVGPSPFYTATRRSYWPSADGSTGYVQAECSATSPTSTSANVTIKNGRVDTATDAYGYPTETVEVPNPTPVNYRVDFTLDNVGEHGYLIFNERIHNSDGSITVNGSHMYMLGPIALGDVVIAQVTCGHS